MHHPKGLTSHAALFLVKRSFVNLTPAPLYCTIFRPHLEYDIQATSPYSMKHIYHTERFQRLATRAVKGLNHLPYIQRLQRLNVCSLEKWRRRADLILALEFFTADMNFRGISSSLYRLVLIFVVTTSSCVIVRFHWLVENLLCLRESPSHGTSNHSLSLICLQWQSSRTD